MSVRGAQLTKVLIFGGVLAALVGAVLLTGSAEVDTTATATLASAEPATPMPQPTPEPEGIAAEEQEGDAEPTAAPAQPDPQPTPPPAPARRPAAPGAQPVSRDLLPPLTAALAGPGEPVGPPPGVLWLSGVIQGEPKLALIRRGENRYLVREGDSLEGAYRVVQIADSTVTLERAGRRQVLRLGRY